MTKRLTEVIMKWKRRIIFILMIVLIVLTTSTVRTYEAYKLKKIESPTIVVEKTEDQTEFPQYNINLLPEVQKYIWERCNELEIPYELELSVLYAESGFDENAVNYNNTCRGMGQISRGTGERVANVLQIDNFWEENVFDAKHNANCSIYHLWELKQIGIERGYSDEDNCLFILGAYNRGIAGYDRYIKKYGKMETGYSDKVLNYKNQLEQYGEFR